MSGAPWSFEPWGEGEPNQNGNEDCTAMDPQNEGFGVTNIPLNMKLLYRLDWGLTTHRYR